VRAVAQRVTSAAVAVGGEVRASIGPGLCVFAAAGRGDGVADVAYVGDKLVHLRVFPEAGGAGGRARMTLSALECGAAVLLVPQFTLYGDVRHGRRPDFTAAAPPEEGRALLAALAARLRQAGLRVEEGVFGADMEVRVAGDGPVTILLDSRRVF
jgi:D-tyrosyl-tRNA(Tyr) deacylase